MKLRVFYIFVLIGILSIVLLGCNKTKNYTVTFDSNGGTEVAQIIVESGKTIQLDNITKEGYIFNGWYTSNNSEAVQFTNLSIVNSDITLYARWTITQYDVNFNCNGGTIIPPIKVDYNEGISISSNPEKDGFVFEGWYLDSGLTIAFALSTKIKENMTLYAKWSNAEYVINFDSNGGTIIPSVRINYNNLLDAPNNPTKVGYTFVGWFKDIEGTIPYNFSTPVFHSFTLYAKYSFDLDEEYLINFDSNNGSLVPSITVNHNDLLTIPTIPIKDDLIFEGWYLDSECLSVYDFSTLVVSSFTLYAKYISAINIIDNVQADTDNITFELKAKDLNIIFSNIEIILLDNDATIDSIITNKLEEIHFGGLSQNTDYRIKIVASFELNQISHTTEVIEEYSFSTNTWIIVITDLNGGAIDNNQTSVLISPFDDITKIPIPTKVGHTFDGWYHNDEKIQDVEELHDNIVIKAKWILLETTISILAPSGMIAEELENLIVEFNKIYPQITIALDVNYASTLLNTNLFDIQARKASDLVFGYPDHFAHYYSSGALKNLQSFIDHEEYGYTSQELNDFIQAYLTDGRGFNPLHPTDLYSMPVQRQTEVLVYNKTFFEGLYGANYEDKIPKTWEQVEIIGKEIILKILNYEADTIIRDGENKYVKFSDKFIGQQNFYPMMFDSSENQFITLVKQFGTDYTQRLNSDVGNILFDNSTTVDMLNYFKYLFSEGVVGSSHLLHYSYSYNLFNNLQCVMSISSSRGLSYFQNSQFEIGIAPIPYQSIENQYVIQQGFNIGILNQNSEAKQLCSWLFMKFLLDPNNSAILAMNYGGNVPIRLSTLQMSEYQSYLQSPPIAHELFAQASKVFKDDYLPSFQLINTDAFIGSDKIRSEVGNLFKDVVFHPYDTNSRFDFVLNYLYPFTNHELEEINSYDDEIQSIYLGNLSSLTNLIELPNKTINNSKAITWELICEDESAVISEYYDHLAIYFYQSNIWKTARLKASITVDDQVQERYWNLYIKPNIVEISSIAVVKSLQNSSSVTISGIVTYVMNSGFYVMDDTGTIFVSNPTLPAASFVPGLEVILQGSKTIYYYEPLIYLSHLTIISDAPVDGFDYSVAVDANIEDIINFNHLSLSNYGLMYNVSGIVQKRTSITDYTTYQIVDKENNQILYIIDTTNDLAMSQLEASVGKEVSLVVISKDYNIYQKVWKFLAVASTIIELSE